MSENVLHSAIDDSGQESQSCERKDCCCMIGTGSKAGLLVYAALAVVLLGLIAYGFLTAA